MEANEANLEILSINVAPGSSEVGDMIKRIDKILPEPLVNEFEGIAQMEDNLQWQKGDLTNRIWENVLAKKLKNKKGVQYTFLDVTYYVSVRFLQGSRSFNTVKAWALVARRYSPVVRRLYHFEDVPFAHFTYAAQRKFDVDSNTGQKLWQDILDYSWELSQTQGRGASVAQLEQKFEGARATKSRFKPTFNDFSAHEIDINGVEIAQLSNIQASPDTLEVEMAETLHRLSGLVLRFANRYPSIGGTVMNAYSVLSNALSSIARSHELQD